MSKVRRLVIVIWSCGPDQPAGATLVAAPLVYALTGRALELDVEVHFTSTAVRWLLSDEAAGAHTDRARSKTVLDYLKEAKAAGVQLYACAMALREHGGGADPIALADGIAGAATVIGASAEDDTKTLVF